MLKEADLAEMWRNKNFDYQVGRDRVADAQYQQQFDYQRSRDSVADSQFAQQLALNRAKVNASAKKQEDAERTIKQDDPQDVNQLYNNLSNKAKEIAGLVEPFALTKDIELIGNVLRNEKQNGNITDSDANILAEIFARKTQK